MWSDYGRFTDLDVHHQYAIVFRTPPYRQLDIDTSRTVYIELFRPSDMARSERKEFTYTPDNYKAGLKRSRYTNYSSSSGSLSSDLLPATIAAMCSTSSHVNISSADLEEALKNVSADKMNLDYFCDSDFFKELFTPDVQMDPESESIRMDAPRSKQKNDMQILDVEFNQILSFAKTNPKNRRLEEYIQSCFEISAHKTR